MSRRAAQKQCSHELTVRTEPRRRTLVDVQAAGEVYLPARRVWERYGIHETTLHRWLHNDEVGFPEPIYIGRYRFWRLSDLVAFEQRDAA